MKNEYKVTTKIENEDGTYKEVALNGVPVLLTLWLGESDDQLINQAITMQNNKG